jgi:hypothetical protein
MTGVPLLAGPFRPGPLLAGPLLAGPLLGVPLLAGPLLGVPLLGGPLLGGRCWAGRNSWIPFPARSASAATGHACAIRHPPPVTRT